MLCGNCKRALPHAQDDVRPADRVDPRRLLLAPRKVCSQGVTRRLQVGKLPAELCRQQCLVTLGQQHRQSQVFRMIGDDEKVQ